MDSLEPRPLVSVVELQYVGTHDTYISRDLGIRIVDMPVSGISNNWHDVNCVKYTWVGVTISYLANS